MQEMNEKSFTEIKAMVDAIINWLIDFVKAVEEMLGGIKYEFAGYKPEEDL